jgi:hypothetical protein
MSLQLVSTTSLSTALYVVVAFNPLNTLQVATLKSVTPIGAHSFDQHLIAGKEI